MSGGYPHSSKYIFICSAEELNSYRFETTVGELSVKVSHFIYLCNL